MPQRKKVLHITIHLPFPTNHGASLFNSYKLISYLNKNHDVFFACFLKGDDVKYKDAFLADTGIKNYYFEVLNVVRNPVNLVKSYLKNMTINMFRNYSHTMKQKIDAIANDYDVIIAEHYEVMQYVPKSFKGKVIFRSHNAEFLIWSRYAEVEKNPIKKLVIQAEANRIKNWEFRYVKQADIVLGGTNDNEIHEPDPAKRKLKFRDYLHIGEDDQIKLPIPDFDTLENSLVYVGTLTWEANIEGLIWFVKGCWEKLKQQFPELKLYIIGKNPDPRLVELGKVYANIQIMGFVEDLETYFTKCKVNIIPLRFGSGMKVKTINGLCRGIPMVCTTIGAEGLKVEHNKDILITDDVEVFGTYVAKLLTDKEKWNSIAKNSKITAAQYYTWDSLYKILDEAI
ncbi:MAG: glycosyltransferase family 4 protein [Bacteroidetes bacterium]|nr:glycosyltransferase family 4 protein [Bacteroidota bacterium]